MMSEKKKLQDFQVRAEGNPGGVRVLEGLGSYVTIHPMADEAQLLAKIGIDPSICAAVDLYWNRGDQVWFVQVHSRSYSGMRPTGIYGCVGSSGYVDILSVVPEEVISSEVVNRELGKIANSKVDLRSLGKKLRPL